MLVAILIVLVVLRPGGIGNAPSGDSEAQNIAAPDFEVTLYQGADLLGDEQLQFSEILDQGKPAVLNFWAGLCPPCRAEMPGFQNVYSEMRDQIVLVGIDIGPFVRLGSREDGRNLVQELGITYPVGTTFDDGVLADYRVRGMPTTVFLTANGEVVKTYSGLMDETTFRNEVQALLEASGGS